MNRLNTKTHFGSCILHFAICIPLILLSACGQGSVTFSDEASSDSGSIAVNTGSIAVSAQWPGDVKTIADTYDDNYARVAPSGVVTLRVIVSGPDMTNMQQDFAATPGQSGSGTITGVPAGTNRTVTLQGRDSDGKITHEGSVSNITVRAGQTTNAGTVVMILVVTGEFTKTISIADTWAGFFDTGTYVLAQNLFLASEIDGSGYIDKIYFEYYSTESTAINCPNTTIKLGHTSVANLNSTFANNVEQGKGSQVTVINDSTITFPAGVPGDFAVINLDTPFYYNGVDNLVVEIERTAACDETFNDGCHYPGFTSVAFTFTDGSLTGIDSNFRNNMKFTFDGGDNYLDFSTGTLTNNSFPFNTNPSTGRKVQLLYPASDIDGSGPITGIGFPVGDTTTNQTYTVTIKLGHSTLSELVSGPFDDSYSDTPFTVASDLTFNVPAGVPQGSVVWLPLTGSFIYNGTDNLILEVETTDNSLATGTTRWWERFGSGVPYYRLYGAVGSATGYPGTDYYFAKFRFNGGTMDVITDGANGTGNIFPPTGMYGRQAMFRSTELGTAGTIEAIACRLASTGPTAATDYPNYTVLMGHTDLTQLSTTFASNYDDETTVHNGTFSLPAGYIEGDWIEIPITPFAYDGIRNLVVYIYSDGATVYSCEMSGSDSIRYPDQTMSTSDYTSATGSPLDYKVDMRFKISP